MFKNLLNIFIVLTILVMPISIIADEFDDIVGDIVDKINPEEISRDVIDTINSGQSNKLESNQDILDTNQQIQNFSGGGDKDTISSKLSGLIGDTPSYTLDGTRTFDGQIICAGETELGTITYTKNSSNNRLTIKLDLKEFGSRTIINITSICADGVLSKSGSKSYGYSFIFELNGKLGVSPRSDLQTCEGIDSYSNYSATEDDYDMLTGQIIKFLSTNTTIGAIVSEKEEMLDLKAVVKLMSQNSTLCGTDTVISDSSDLYSYTSPETLYQVNSDGPLNIPDGSSAMGEALSNEDSIYYMMTKSLDTEYAEGVSIGTGDNNICVIENNIVGVIGGYETDGGCPFSESNCSYVIDVVAGSEYSTCVQEREIIDSPTGSGEFSGICGEYTLNVTKRDGSPSFNFQTGNKDHNNSWSPIATFKGKITDPDEKLEYSAISKDSNLSLIIKLETKFKTSNTLSLSTQNSCITNDKKCEIFSEKVCKSNKTDCIYTVKNAKRLGKLPVINNEMIRINGKDFRLDADGNKLIVTDEDSNAKEFTVDDGLGYPYIERVYTCPTSDSDGLEVERDILENLLGNYDEDYLDKNLVAEDCAIPICVVNIMTEDRTVVNTDTGETRIDVGNAASIIKEVRSCELIAGSDNFSCPIDLGKNESIASAKNDCSCDTEKLMDTIGGTLSGLEVMRQIAEGNQTQCAREEETETRRRRR